MFIVNKMATLKGNTKKFSYIIGNQQQQKKKKKKKKKTTKNVVNINLSVEEI